MTTYISFDTALRIFVNAYLVSVVLLLLASAIGLAVIESMDIALQCGFSSHSHLGKWFRQQTGVTPKKYRVNFR